MKPLSRMIALLASVAHLVAACSNATVNQPKPASTNAAGKAAHASTDQTAQSASTSPQFVNDWPPGTPDLRDVIFEFTVTGEKKHVLSDDGSGFLVIQNAQTSEAAKLVFFDGTRALYHMPARKFDVISVGSEFICKDIAITVSAEKDSEVIFNVEIRIGTGISGEGSAFILLRGSAVSAGSCHRLSDWDKIEPLDREKTEELTKKIEKASKSRASTGERIALGIVGAVLLLPAAILLGGAGLGTYKTK